MNNTLCFRAGLLLLMLLASSCSRKTYVYLQDMQVGENYPVDDRSEAIVHVDDRLGITVSCKNPELAIPFNIFGGTFRVGKNGEVDTDAASKVNERGYRVDIDGNIDFPILGKLHVEGLTVSEVRDLIKERIEEGNYMKDPLVSIEFLNFKYTVLGAVARNGTFSADGDRVTLLDAIAMAGDVTSKARVDRVAVIREQAGGRQLFLHDLRSTEIFESPCFYLQQNDIVYVEMEPKYYRRDSANRNWEFARTMLSVATVVCSLLWVLK